MNEQPNLVGTWKGTHVEMGNGANDIQFDIPNAPDPNTGDLQVNVTEWRPSNPTRSTKMFHYVDGVMACMGMPVGETWELRVGQTQDRKNYLDGEYWLNDGTWKKAFYHLAKQETS